MPILKFAGADVELLALSSLNTINVEELENDESLIKIVREDHGIFALYLLCFKKAPASLFMKELLCCRLM